MFSSRSGHTEVVKYLVELSADVTIQNENGWTALHGSWFLFRHHTHSLSLKSDGKNSWHGHRDCVQILLDAKADAAGKNSDGWACVHGCFILKLIDDPILLFRLARGGLQWSTGRLEGPACRREQHGTGKFGGMDRADVCLFRGKRQVLPFSSFGQIAHSFFEAAWRGCCKTAEPRLPIATRCVCFSFCG